MRTLKGIVPFVVGAIILLSCNVLGQTPRAATATATVVNGFVVAITVVDGGFGYTAPPTVQVTGGLGVVATATVANGMVEKISVMEAGSGYPANPAVIISPPPTSRTARATATIVNGFLVSISVTDGGFGYSVPPIITINDAWGSGAEVLATISQGAVDRIAVVNAGAGYSDTTTVMVDPPAAPSAPFEEGLVAFYPFNSDADDESGTGNNGVILDATISSDRFGMNGKSVFFPGLGYVFVNNTPSIEALGVLTVAAWVKFDSLEGPNGVSIVSKVSDDGSALAWNFAIAPDGKLRLFANAGGWGHFDCTTKLEPGLWYHVAMVYNGSQLMGFVNGQLDGVSNLPGTLAASNRPMRIGVYSPNIAPDNRMFFRGNIDEVRVYRRALAPQEVTDLFHYEAPEAPWVSLAVKTIEVTLYVKPGRKYQLQASRDVANWVNVGQQFVPTSSKLVQDFSASEVGRYFRLCEVK